MSQRSTRRSGSRLPTNHSPSQSHTTHPSNNPRGGYESQRGICPGASSNLLTNHSSGEAKRNAPHQHLPDQQKTGHCPDTLHSSYSQENPMAKASSEPNWAAGPNEEALETFSDRQSYFEEEISALFHQEVSSESYQESFSEICQEGFCKCRQEDFSGCCQECFFGSHQECFFGSHRKCFFDGHQEQSSQDNFMDSRKPSMPSSSAPTGSELHADPWSEFNQRRSKDLEFHFQGFQNSVLDKIPTNAMNIDHPFPVSDPVWLELNQEVNQNARGSSQDDQELGIRRGGRQAGERTENPEAQPAEDHSTPSASTMTTVMTTSPPSTSSTLSVKCPHCPQWFNGKYGKGNLGRHKRHAHAPGRQFLKCQHGCEKWYTRTDARQKHYRECHPNII